MEKRLNGLLKQCAVFAETEPALLDVVPDAEELLPAWRAYQFGDHHKVPRLRRVMGNIGETAISIGLFITGLASMGLLPKFILFLH